MRYRPSPRDIVRITQPWNPPEHYGTDYSCYVGTPILAAEAGVAYPREQSGGFGRYVVVETPTHYVYCAHLSEWWVKEGERVVAGQVIGLSGNTGRSTGPHVHFEVRAKAGSPYLHGAVDPDAWLAEGIGGEEEEGYMLDEERERIVAARWNAEEAVRQIEQTIETLQQARQRLVEETIPKLYAAEGQGT